MIISIFGEEVCEELQQKSTNWTSRESGSNFSSATDYVKLGNTRTRSGSWFPCLYNDVGMPSTNHSTRNNIISAFMRVLSAAVKKGKLASKCAAIECISGKQVDNPYLLTRIPPLEINPDI